MKIIFLLMAFLHGPSLTFAMHSKFTLTGSRLKLSGTILSPRELSRLLPSNDFKNIKEFNISHSKIDPKLFSQLPADLEKLSMNSVTDLRGNMLSIDQCLKNTLYFNNLKALSLENQSITDSQLSIIAEMQAIQELKLPKNQIGAIGAARISIMIGITILDLSSNQLRDDGAARLLSMQGIKELYLGSNKIGDAGAASLSTIQGIRTLYLSNNQIGDAGAASLSTMQGIKELYLGSNQIGDAGAASLSTIQGIGSLYLSNNQIGDAGAARILTMQAITDLLLDNQRTSNISRDSENTSTSCQCKCTIL